MKGEILVGKYCKLNYKNGFGLTGVVLETGNSGLIFETKQKVSFISWDEIKCVTVEE